MRTEKRREESIFLCQENDLFVQIDIRIHCIVGMITFHPSLDDPVYLHWRIVSLVERFHLHGPSNSTTYDVYGYHFRCSYS